MPHFKNRVSVKKENGEIISTHNLRYILNCDTSKFLMRVLFLLAILFVGLPLYAQSPIPGINISIDSATSPQQVATTLQIVFLLTVLTMAPAILIMTTSFTRFVIVLSFLRQAIGTPQAPSNQIVIGLALFLSLFVMMPVWEEVNQVALEPYLEETISQQEFMDRATLLHLNHIWKRQFPNKNLWTVLLYQLNDSWVNSPEKKIWLCLFVLPNWNVQKIYG